MHDRRCIPTVFVSGFLIILIFVSSLFVVGIAEDSDSNAPGVENLPRNGQKSIGARY